MPPSVPNTTSSREEKWRSTSPGSGYRRASASRCASGTSHEVREERPPSSLSSTLSRPATTR
ncbi:hypothetical protein [Micromonospora thermarum]|uniref:Uncharacterized protein n=1 Tax=Micromonospora thermarum TaxID=2720024 RepID=A0ABX0Z6C5_9ACTN|nr:hypothetical protein [Micromonospora thermarum]NJP32692.1 hypothetical protein [Micromonospora thermarum]